MRELPHGANLLDTARARLRTDIVAALPPQQRHLALMIANAMAIAAREMACADEADYLEMAALGALLSLPPATATHEQLAERNRLLCARIRDGQADPGSVFHLQARALLLKTSRAKVAISNPKYLERRP